MTQLPTLEGFKKDAPRLAISLGVVLAFVYAIGWHWSASLEATVINIAMIVVGYWFGSSKGSSDKTEQIGQQITQQDKAS